MAGNKPSISFVLRHKQKKDVKISLCAGWPPDQRDFWSGKLDKDITKIVVVHEGKEVEVFPEDFWCNVYVQDDVGNRSRPDPSSADAPF
jgi:hypothetical protein